MWFVKEKGSMWRCLKMSHRIECKNRQILIANPSKNDHFFKNPLLKDNQPFLLRFEVPFFSAVVRTDGRTVPLVRFADSHPPCTLRFRRPFWNLFSSMEHFYKHRSLRSRWTIACHMTWRNYCADQVLRLWGRNAQNGKEIHRRNQRERSEQCL